MEPITEKINQLTEELANLHEERNRQIVQAARDGERNAEIARRYGITRERVGQLVKHFKRIAADGYPTDPAAWGVQDEN